MPKRQKLLMIVLALVLAYAAYEFLLTGDSGTPGTASTTSDFTSGRVQAETNQTQTQTTNRTQRQVAQAGQGTRTFQPPPNLELRDDPFSRPLSLKPVVVDTQVQPSQLTGLTLNGTFGKMVLINDNPYQVNDIIMGFTIIEFTSERVILSDNEGKKHVLRKN